MTSASNAPTGYLYDAAGNLVNDGSNQYAYDGEGRLCAMYNPLTTTVTAYLYDAADYRVVKGPVSNAALPLTSAACVPTATSSGTEDFYVVGLDGTALDETDQNGNLLHSNVLANGQLLATYTPSLSNWTYSFNDWLGTKRVVAESNGTVYEVCGSLPYGDALDCLGGADPSEQHFTGKERDTESQLDYFGARYYGSSMGRFMSPDYSSVDDGPPDAIPSGSISSPQSLNGYAYVGNNPLGRTDPDGHDCIYADGNGGGYVKTGDCYSDTDNGIYVDGTININSFQYNALNNSSTFSYTPYDSAPGTIGTGVLQGPNLTNGFDPGSLAAGVFGPQNNGLWNNAAGAVSPAGVAAFYGASGAIAACIVACPAAGAAALAALRAAAPVALPAGAKLAQMIARAAQAGANFSGNPAGFQQYVQGLISEAAQAGQEAEAGFGTIYRVDNTFLVVKNGVLTSFVPNAEAGKGIVSAYYANGGK